MKILVVGSGGVGSSFAAIASRRTFFEKLILTDINEARAQAVVDKVGMAEFNAVWQEPAHLPTKAEITDPDAWVARVL